MPCVFSGIFYVESFAANRTLQCHFKDDDEIIRHLSLTHFQTPNVTDHPFPDAFKSVQSGLVYLITGTFAIHLKNNFMVPFYL